MCIRDRADTAKSVLDRELRKDDPNMGAISKALWWMRYAASVPNKEGLIYFEDAVGQMGTQAAMLIGNSYPKVQKIVELCQEAKAKGEKVIVFTSLRAFHAVLVSALKQANFRILTVTSSTPSQQLSLIHIWLTSSSILPSTELADIT